MTKRASALFAAALLGAAGCSGGSKGDTGPAGPPGPGGGDVGPGGMGALTVHVTFDRVNSTSIPAALPAPGVYCFTNPDFTGNSSDTLAEAVSDANGNAVLSVPGGKYKVQCRPAAPGKAADYANDMPLTAEVAVAAGGSATVEVLANRTNPLYFTKTPKVSGARIATAGAKVDVGEVSVAGATITVTPVAKKSVVDVTVAGDNTFSVPDVDVVLAGLSATYGAGTPPLRTPGRGVWGAFELPEGLGFVGLGDGVARSMAKGLAFDVKATSGDSTTTVRVTGAIAGLQDIQGISTGPIGVMVIGSDTKAETYAWTLAGQTFKNVAIDPLPALNGAATRNPYFIPTVEGVYTLTNTASGHVLTFTAGTYTGLLAADGTGSACSQCHDDENGAGFYVKKIKHYASTADYFFHNMGVHGNHNYFSDPSSRASQATTAATIFQWGLQGIDYAPTCYRCHTTGSFWTNSNGPAATVDNGGFQSRLEAIDAAAKTKDPNAVSLSKSWAGDGQDHWANLDGGLKAMAGIQCESCHGPASGHMAKGGDVARLAQPYAVGACAVCHDAPGHHDKVELWSKSGHGNAALAIEEGAGSASCARCHGAQGFKAYIDQLAKKGSDCASWQDSKGAAITLGADGTLPNRNLPWADQLYVHVGDKDANGQYVCKQAAAGADLASLGVDPATVQPQTCQACHEAHSTELRVEGDTSVLAVGFQVNGAGAGALCMTCHNGRNGPRGDNVAPPTAGIASSHTADQTEVLLGQNFYWVNGVVSKHAAVKDTCVGCHVQLHPDSVQTGNDNHTFEADETICKNCHGANVGPETLFAQYDAGIKALGQAMLKALGPSFTIVGKTSEVVVTTSNATITSYGRSGLSLVFATPIAAPDAATGTVTKYTVALNKLKDASGTTGTLTGRLAKAGWNWSMLWNRSAAVHNPTLTFQVLTVSAQKVQDPAAGAL